MVSSPRTCPLTLQWEGTRTAWRCCIPRAASLAPPSSSFLLPMSAAIRLRLRGRFKAIAPAPSSTPSAPSIPVRPRRSCCRTTGIKRLRHHDGIPGLQEDVLLQLLPLDEGRIVEGKADVLAVHPPGDGDRVSLCEVRQTARHRDELYDRQRSAQLIDARFGDGANDEDPAAVDRLYLNQHRGALHKGAERLDQTLTQLIGRRAGRLNVTDERERDLPVGSHEDITTQFVLTQHHNGQNVVGTDHVRTWNSDRRGCWRLSWCDVLHQLRGFRTRGWSCHGRGLSLGRGRCHFRSFE